MSGKVLTTTAFDSLIPSLRSRGYRVIGPTVHERTIVFGELASAADLPVGWTDDQEAGHYRIHRRDDDAYFAYTVGPRTLKRYLYPARQTLLTIEHAETGLRFRPEPTEEPRYAFIGVRSCEIAAAAIQDRVFGNAPFADPGYVQRRRASFTVAVNCSVAGATCFCDSMGTGPRATDGYDLVVTELLDGGSHEFLVDSGSGRGAEILDALDGREATDRDQARVDEMMADTISHMGRRMPPDTRDIVAAGVEHHIWDDIAERCLSCTNCTLVCPTCFCSTVEDRTDLLGTAVRERRWDSCFSEDFTNLHGHPVRGSTRSRYRQWMSHKLSWWFDQFGTSGCVGCGRCITWCPVGIDITAEVARLEEETEVYA
jgi:4Fe-4S dicluster domain